MREGGREGGREAGRREKEGIGNDSIKVREIILASLFFHYKKGRE